MRLQLLSCLSFFLFSAAVAQDSDCDCSQTVTIQRFTVNDSSPETLDTITEAMSEFKAAHSDEIDAAFFGVVPDTNPIIAEQAFLWRSPADSSLDVAEPFLRFSTTGELNGSATAILPNKTSVYMSFRAPVTETIFQNIVPGSDLERLEAVSAYLSVNIRSYKDGNGSSIGWEYNGTRRIVLGGWATLTASDEWLAGVDNVTATVYGVLDTTIVNMDPLYKPLVEID
ncbi:hypothetical protein AAF712_012266 [Marasmius tenuissimus]|uniref:Uncharacterized protein n=1 Tax=Marasmius tenuissimus TaxID=585030 RepID=A0ABR2ZGZ8_9AGAR